MARFTKLFSPARERECRDALLERVRTGKPDLKLAEAIHNECGNRSAGPWLAGAVRCWWLDHNREQVARTGQCSGGCSAQTIVEHFATERPVCPQTFMPCSYRRLAAIVQHLGKVNA